MKKLILGIAMFIVGISKFVDIYNISTILRSAQSMMRFNDFDFVVCTFFGAIMFIIGIAGIAVAFIGAFSRKRSTSEVEK